MANVVFTTVNSLEEIDSAVWRAGDNESYAHTKRMVPDHDGIRLIGRQATDGSVQLCYAASNFYEWTEASGRHLKLARYFLRKFDQAPAGDTMRVFFNEIDDQHTAYEAQQLIALECGINVTKEKSGKLHLAVLQVQRGLNALGVPCGDWTFVPMFKSFKTAA